MALIFDKGCYTGQEVIARMHYLGKAKKRLFRITTDTTTDQSAQLKHGMPVFDQDGTKLGEIFSVSPNIESGDEQEAILENLASTDQIGLAVLTNEHKNDNKTDERHQYWANQVPNHPDSISISAVLTHLLNPY